MKLAWIAAPAFACAIAMGCAEVGTSALTGVGGNFATSGNGARATTTSGSTNAGPTGAGGATTAGPSGTGTTTSGTATTSGTTGPTTSGAGGATTTAASSTSGGGAGGAPTTTGAGGSYDTPPTCTSMTMYLGGNDAQMKPGSACKSCHVLLGQATGKTFDVGGTVYPTAHEPDDCNGVNVNGAVVVITDGNGVDTPLPVNDVGNFYHYDLFGVAAFKTPMHARVEYNGQVRKMIGSITNGDCDSCHTETGTQSAPGRIMLP